MHCINQNTAAAAAARLVLSLSLVYNALAAAAAAHQPDSRGVPAAARTLARAFCVLAPSVLSHSLVIYIFRVFYTVHPSLLYTPQCSVFCFSALLLYTRVITESTIHSLRRVVPAISSIRVSSSSSSSSSGRRTFIHIHEIKRVSQRRRESAPVCYTLLLSDTHIYTHLYTYYIYIYIHIYACLSLARAALCCLSRPAGLRIYIYTYI